MENLEESCCFCWLVKVCKKQRRWPWPAAELGYLIWPLKGSVCEEINLLSVKLFSVLEQIEQPVKWKMHLCVSEWLDILELWRQCLLAANKVPSLHKAYCNYFLLTEVLSIRSLILKISVSIISFLIDCLNCYSSLADVEQAETVTSVIMRYKQNIIS